MTRFVPAMQTKSFRFLSAWFQSGKPRRCSYLWREAGFATKQSASNCKSKWVLQKPPDEAAAIELAIRITMNGPEFWGLMYARLSAWRDAGHAEAQRILDWLTPVFGRPSETPAQSSSPVSVTQRIGREKKRAEIRVERPPIPVPPKPSNRNLFLEKYSITVARPGRDD